MSKRFFDFDPLTGAFETYEYDEENDASIIHRTADVSSILEDNKRRATDGTNGFNKDRDMVHVAHIPIDVCYLWLTKYGIDVNKKDHWPAVKKLLNSNEWRYLRISNIVL